MLTLYNLQRLICNACKSCFTAPSPAAGKSNTVDETPISDEEASKNSMFRLGRCNRNAMANAMVALFRFWFGVPHYRLAKIQSMMGIPLPESTQYRMLLQVYLAAKPIYYHLVEEAANGRLLMADDTRMTILSWLSGRGPPRRTDGKPKKRAQTTAVISKQADGKTIALYLTSGDEAGREVRGILKKRQDTSTPHYMSDGLAANFLGEDISCIRLHCMDHARRYFYDLKSIYPKEVERALGYFSEVYYNDALSRLAMHSSEERKKYHQEHSRPVMDSLGKWMQEELSSGRVEENSELGKAMNYSLRRWTELNEFHHLPGAPLSNAECERLIKSIITHRKNSLHYKTLKGAIVGDIIQSIIATCRYAKVNPAEYLDWIQRNRSKCEESPQEFTPWAFKEKISGENRRSA